MSLNSNIFALANQSQLAQGIICYAGEKMNIKQGEQLFFMPRLADNSKLKPALIKREPEWWMGSELSTQGYAR